MPGFNVNGTGTGKPNTTEQTRKHRFLVRIFEPLTPDLLFFAHKISIPNVEIDRVVMHHKQEEIYLPGKHKLQQCEMSIYRVHDYNGDRAAREIHQWWAKNLIDIEQSSIKEDENGNFLKRNCRVDILDGAGVAVHAYFLYGIWPYKVMPDPFDFGDDKVSDISIGFYVDKMLEVSGVGLPFGTTNCDGV